MKFVNILSLLFLTSVSLADSLVMEVSVVTDWETVSYYSSIEQIESRITSAFAHANKIYEEQLNIKLKIVLIDIPSTEEQDVITNDTYPSLLLKSLNNYRKNNTEHRNADATVLFTKRNINGFVGFAGIGSICTDLSSAIVQLTDNGLDYLLLAHELGHILGAVHDGDSPCEDEENRYLMGASVFMNSPFFSQCSIDTINSTIKNYGNCLNNNPRIFHQKNSGGGGVADILFLLLMMWYVIVRKLKGTCGNR